LLFE
jgi:hypothetical protein